MDNIYVCRECGFMIREIELAEWTKHDFVNKANVFPDEIPDHNMEIDCEGYEILVEYPS